MDSQGVFTIDGFGDGARNAGALSTASLEVSPDTEVSGRSWRNLTTACMQQNETVAETN